MHKFLSGKFWVEMNTHLWKAAIFCLVLTLIWILISAVLYSFEGSRSYFELHAVLRFKIILAAMAFLGRYLLFPKYRRPEWLGWLIGLSFLLIAGLQGKSLYKTGLSGAYIFFKLCDAAVWGLFIAGLIETVGALFAFWYYFKKVAASQLDHLWQEVRRDTLSLGIFLTLSAGLCYYYLTSFYLVDTLFYSYILLAPVLVPGPVLYLMILVKVNLWLGQDIQLLDLEISNYLEWQNLKEETEWAPKLIRFEYLTLIRNYLTQIGKPKFPWKIGGGYLIFCVFVLALPYIFGLAVEVGSFK